MKKSNKKSVSINDMIDDISHLLEFVNDLNTKDFEDIDLNEVDKKTDKFKKKYKNILPKESEDNLDPKE
tara:strand:+ start:416 stop:622 length:207 start_codon:yes stop_codon:yes gene_type:complete